MRVANAFLLAAGFAVQASIAQSLVPDLNESGRRGEIARAEKARAAARFDALDLDKDGFLSREEVAKGGGYLADSFDKKDTNKDGRLNWEEYLGHNRWPK